MAKKKTTQKKKSTSPSIGLSADTRKKACSILNGILSDQHVLYIKTRNFHWNLIGGRFHTLHEHFEEMYNELAVAIDETAERIRMLGGVSPGSMKEFLANATLKEEKGAIIDGDAAIESLLSDHESVAQSLRKDIEKLEEDLGDVGSADFLTALLQKHEQTSWMLRSYLDVSGS
ncbi:Dps family protein [Roseibacillus persicicus]|uniref:DNA starvation/stationary phase protection protein n=1 Tax=Roseibacillus persicicus TaxID=454148 RepID=A0A918U2H3_9BACT|nr:DNA starvation/stationary phase protection protein [Roseibacillus persicicus]MDQ8192291.1 DNA starvation/stationary phase protection protein [Roseibacillus persicicus]GHC67514.1 DNA starvation/stationary phase protection protein [Roseibacillus persicicus]